MYDGAMPSTATKPSHSERSGPSVPIKPIRDGEGFLPERAKQTATVDSGGKGDEVALKKGHPPIMP